MATKPKASLQDEAALRAAPDIAINELATESNLEDAIAESLLDDIDWRKVRAAIISKAKHRFVAWLSSGNHSTPINLSPFPELSALPSRDDEVKAA